MNRRPATTLTYCLTLATMSIAAPTAFAQQLPKGVVIKQLQPGISAISADSGNWAGESMGTSHQNTNLYRTEKTLIVPEGALEGVREVRLRVFMAMFDNGNNGLDESFIFTVNGKEHLVRDNDPTLPGAKWEWHDFNIPVSELKTGENVFMFTKAPSEKNDDYMYVGIAAPTNYGYSRMSQDGGKTWTKESLNAIKAIGEYMVQLVLIKNDISTSATWTSKNSGPTALVGYSGMEDSPTGPSLNLELEPYEVDPKQPFKVTISTTGAEPKARWLDSNNAEIPGVKSRFENGALTAEFPASRMALARVEIAANAAGKSDVSQVRFDYSPVLAAEKRGRINMAPIVSAPKGKPQQRAPRARITEGGFVLENATQVATFSTKPALRLTALRNEYLQKNVLAHPELTHLFLTEIAGKRYGAEDWKVQQVKALSPTSIQVVLALPEPALRASFAVSIDAKDLKFGLEITNASQSTQTWKTAFPQIGGLQLSQQESDDHYLFPLWGGVIASQNVNLRSFYGDESAWWQMITLFSPQGGSGLSVRNLDETGLFKGIAMRKGLAPVDGGTFLNGRGNTGLDPEMLWQDSLKPGAGSALSYEYVKFTREPGKSFAPPSAALQMYSGDWHVAMKTYADWAHKVWKWRPWPSIVRDRWNVISPGWQQKPLLDANAKWRTDYINDKADVAELMSWWTWSKKGPWQVPMDQLQEKLGDGLFNGYKTYWVINPATGKLEYPINRGDYDYNKDWGGLPALKKQLQRIREGGQQPWFYTDPFLADDNTELGQKYGRKYGIMNPRWSDYQKVPLNPPGYAVDYASWNMCLDTKWYMDYVTKQMTRVVRDTDVDGIRFDQFGLANYVCSNPAHTHVFAEPGHNAGLQASTEMCRMVQESINKFKPGFALTAEFSGYDRYAAVLEGAINYESARQTFEGFRPIPLNVFRFYFPEHKHFDLDDKGRPHGPEWRFWNATGAFDSLHPPRYFRILKENSDTFDTRQAHALVPSLVEGVYANRFEGGGKTITILYNAHGLTVNRPLLTAHPKAGYHYFDLLQGREIAPQNGAFALKIRPDQVAAIAQLPKVLTLQNSAAGLQLTLSKAVPKAKVLLCNAEGEVLKSQAVSGQKATVSLEGNSTAVYVKLLSDKYLVDAQEIPGK